MKNSEKTFFALIIIFLVIAIIILPLRMFLYNENYYYSQFEKNKVSVEGKEEILDNLLNFFKGKEKLEYFKENEQSHLEDVKALLSKLFFTLYFSIIATVVLLVALFFLFTEDFKADVFKIFFLAGLSSFALVALLSLAAINFSVSFEGFHLLLFPQGNYTFAESSLLITMFPPIFFKSFLFRLLIGSVIISFIAMAPQIIMNKMKK